MKKYIVILTAIVTLFCMAFSHKQPPIYWGMLNIDADAQKFVKTAQLLNTTQINAVNRLVKQAKQHGWWSKCIAIYPFVGGDTLKCKWNLKDPRDLDAAYRIIWSGKMVNNVNGAPNNTVVNNAGIKFDSSYADTRIAPFTALANASTHLCFCTTTIPANTSDRDMGAANSADSSSLSITMTNTAGGSFYQSTPYTRGENNTFSPTTLLVKGTFIGTRTASGNSVAAYNNGSVLTTTPTVTPLSNGGKLPSNNIFIGARNGSFVGSYPANNSVKTFTFATIGTALTATDAANMHTDITAFNTLLGR